MSWLADLRTSALVGTARHAVPPPPAHLNFCPPTGQSPEESLLDQAALADVATRAARLATKIDPGNLPHPAPPDAVPEAESDAAQLLELLLAQPPVGLELRTQLVAEWLQLAVASGRRVPHRLLPALLSLADSKPLVAEHLHPAIGTRGNWLQELISNGAADPETAADWVELKSADATLELERLRNSDPAAARELLGTHWDALGAKERAAHLAVFATNLEPADENMLERALDDKAKSVREVASGLLDRLPGSARADRMAARLKPLLRVKGFLNKTFEIDMPPEPDAAALRDGIAPAPHNGEPDRLARLDTIIRGAPLDVWTKVAGRSPAETVALLAGETRVINAIVTVAALRADLDWVRALLRVRPGVQLLNCLPPDERERSLLEHIRGGVAQPLMLVPLLRDIPRPWGSPLADQVLELISAKNGGQLATLVASFLPMALPPDAADRCQRLESADDDASRRRVFRDVVQYQSFRQSLTEAFR